MGGRGVIYMDEGDQLDVGQVCLLFLFGFDEGEVDADE